MWLQVKCLRVLQYFPPPEDPVVSKQLNTILKQIVASTLLILVVLHTSLHRLSCHMLMGSLNPESEEKVDMRVCTRFTYHTLC